MDDVGGVLALLPAGTLLGDRYEIVGRRGAGGMGVVFEVLDHKTQRRRAAKVLLTDPGSSAETAQRLALEATATSQLSSPHLLDIQDVGVDARSGMPFLVMELLDGEDLATVLRRRGRLPIDEVVGVLDVLARVLDPLHEAAIVHRDLKPENVFLAREADGQHTLKLLDFGAAKRMSASLRTTRALGSPLYMSPEALDGAGTLDGRADVYALGHLAFTLLIGEAFWERALRDARGYYGAALKIMGGRSQGASARAAELGVALPGDFERWFSRATARDAADRFETAGECAAALARAVRAPGRRVRSKLGPALAFASVVAGVVGALALSHDRPAASLSTEVVADTKVASAGAPALDVGDPTRPTQPIAAALVTAATPSTPARRAGPVRPAPRAAAVPSASLSTLPLADQDAAKTPTAERTAADGDRASGSGGDPLISPSARAPGRRASAAGLRARRAGLTATLLAGTVWWAPSDAGAQTTARDPVSAEALFHDGMELVAGGGWEEGCSRFDASQALDPSPSTLIWIGRCHERFGRVASAWYAFQSARKLNLESTSSADRRESLARVATEGIASVVDRVPHLRIVVASPPPDLRVSRDGVPVPVAALAQDLAVDPGSTTVRFEAEGFATLSRTIELAEGRRLEIEARLEPLPEALSTRVDAPRPPLAPRPPPRGDAQPPSTWLSWSLIGVGAGAITTGLSFGAVTVAKVTSSSDECTAANVCSLRGWSLRQEAGGLEAAAWTLGGIGVAATAAGIVLLGTSSGEAPSVRASVAPGGLSCSGAF